MKLSVTYTELQDYVSSHFHKPKSVIRKSFLSFSNDRH